MPSSMSYSFLCKRIALDQRDGMRASTKPDMERVHAAHALARVGEQGLPVAVADRLAEQFQVAAEVEDIGVGCEHDVRQDVAAVALLLDTQAVGEHLLVAQDLVDERGLEACAPRRLPEVGMHVAPVGPAIVVVDRAERAGRTLEQVYGGHGEFPCAGGRPAGRSGRHVVWNGESCADGGILCPHHE